MAQPATLQQNRTLMAAAMLPRMVQLPGRQLPYRQLAVIAFVISKMTTFTKEISFGTWPGSIMGFSLGFGSRIPGKIWASLPLLHVCSYIRGVVLPKILSNNRFKACGLDAYGFFCGQLPTPLLPFLHHVTISVQNSINYLRDRGGLGALKQYNGLRSLTFVLEPILPEPMDTTCGRYSREILDALRTIFFDRELATAEPIVALSITGNVATFATGTLLLEAVSTEPEDRDPETTARLIAPIRLILQSRARNELFRAERKQAIADRRQWMSANGVPFPSL
ncbi:hypothetical protein BU16DRAFT_532450 [Lophium mytilinum]|uniref:Uncharacterized protein n=1 Tax=Lophium mytilinum TaxID=390894 RepID=A0A6A6RB58_9PEZI|nr:hypothetical protein BU16DRAFT_532450 [Lophium mytilinum]